MGMSHAEDVMLGKSRWLRWTLKWENLSQAVCSSWACCRRLQEWHGLCAVLWSAMQTSMHGRQHYSAGLEPLGPASDCHRRGLDRGVWAIGGRPVWNCVELTLGLTLGLCCGPAKGSKFDLNLGFHWA